MSDVARVPEVWYEAEDDTDAMDGDRLPRRLPPAASP